MLEFRMTQARRIVLWVMLAVLAALVATFAFRGYFSAEFLFNFSNSFWC
jgi:hypothetical protein